MTKSPNKIRLARQLLVILSAIFPQANLNFKMHFRKCFFYGKVSYGVEIYETYFGGKAQKCYIGGKKKGDDDLPKILKSILWTDGKKALTLSLNKPFTKVLL